MRNLSAKVSVGGLADRQSGRVSAAQLAALGIDGDVIKRWVAADYLYVVLPRVYAVGHRAPSVEAELTAAVLYAGPGAMLSHATGIWWLGLSDHRPRPIDVSTPRRCRSLHAVKVHGRRTCERVWHDRLPTTTIEQTLLDYAAVAPLHRVRRALAVADFKKLLDLDALHAIAGCGRSGSTALRQALMRHEPRLARTRSPMEELFVPLCERAGIPVPDINVFVEGVLVDAVWWDCRLIVELDGRDNHSSWAQIQKDRSNEMKLRAARFEVLRYGTQQLDEEAALVEVDLKTALGLPA